MAIKKRPSRPNETLGLVLIALELKTATLSPASLTLILRNTDKIVRKLNRDYLHAYDTASPKNQVVIVLRKDCVDEISFVQFS
jgi:hypothetical protein